ncbi:hypothetical protein PG997_015354 [Apiospora hydei]|uniref:Uncharacterized protein n=1 Tax=Apiospora hydei TaxID=1337664 RepID=A0ABR1UQF5_9PEZI
MCNRFAVRLLCGHKDVGYDYCPHAVPNGRTITPLGSRFGATPGSMRPCRDVIDEDPSGNGTRDRTYKCKVSGCRFEAVQRSWLCCKCWSRPNTEGTCAGLEGAVRASGLCFL